MSKKIIDLGYHRKVREGYHKLLEKNPDTVVSFKNYCKIQEFLRKVHDAKIKKGLKKDKITRRPD